MPESQLADLPSDADLHETGEKIRKEREAAERQQLLARQQARAQAVASGAAYYATCARCGGSGSIRYKVTTYQEMDRYEKMAEDKLRSSNFGFWTDDVKGSGVLNRIFPMGIKGQANRSVRKCVPIAAAAGRFCSEIKSYGNSC